MSIICYRKTLPYCDRPKLIEDTSEPNIGETASLLERRLVHAVYEEIAGHFSDTRHKPWPRVSQFINVSYHAKHIDKKLNINSDREVPHFFVNF